MFTSQRRRGISFLVGEMPIEVLNDDLLEKHKKQYMNKFLDFDKENKFLCQYCPDDFEIYDAFKNHIMEVHEKSWIFDKEEKKYACKLCYHTFTKNRSLQDHFNKIHVLELDNLDSPICWNDLTHQCEKYEVKFISEEILRYHNQNNHNVRIEKSSRSTVCKLCYLTFTTRRSLQHHLRKVHVNDADYFERDLTDEDLKFKCQICSKKFVSQPLLKSHLGRHKLEKYECLRDKAYDPASKMYMCKLCHIPTQYFRNYVAHISYIHKGEISLFERQIDDEELIFSCNGCELKFIDEMSWDHHNTHQHETIKLKHCKLCNINFKTNNGYLQHKYKVHQYELEVFKRNISHNSLWLRHIKVLHKSDMDLLNSEEEYPLTFSCHICDKKFVKEHILRYHVTYKHKGDADNQSYCQLCYVDFTSSKRLKQHKKNIHRSKEERAAFGVKLETSNLPFECNFCPKRFLTDNILQYHYHYNHKEEQKQDLSCNYCNKVFKWCKERKRNMEKHKKSHTQKKSCVRYKICMKIVKKQSIKQQRSSQNSNRDAQCKLCYMYLKTDRILKDHYKNVYKSEMEQTFLLGGGSIDQFEIQCNECDLKFLNDDLLEKHKRQHLNKFAKFEKVNNYLCQLCTDTFLSYSNLKEHTSVVHGVSWGSGQEDKEFACKLCSNAFKFKGILADHFKKIHTDDFEKVTLPISLRDLLGR